MNNKQLFLLGFRKTLHFQWGLVPFGVLYATLAIDAGFPPWLTLFTSIVVVGGSSQLVFIDLFKTLSSPLQAVIGSNIVNARHLIYSAAVSEEFSHFKLRWKIILTYLLTDHLYAVSQAERKIISQIDKEALAIFYFGSISCTYIFWILSTILGIIFGHFIPSSWNLGFSIPLMFMPLVFIVSKNRFAYITSVLAILFVWLFQVLPYGLGVFFSILLSALIGFKIEKYFGVKE